MKIRLYKPVSIYLIDLLGNNQIQWQNQLSKWTGLKITLPKYFWEVHLFIINGKTPGNLTIECIPEKGWHSVFYSYNLNGDMQKYIELSILRKCKRHREQNNQTKITKAG